MYTSLVDRLDSYSLTGVSYLHTGGYYRGNLLRSAGSEIGSNELAVSLLLSGRSEDLWSWLKDTGTLLKGKGVVSVNTTHEDDFFPETIDANQFGTKNKSEDRSTSIYPDFYDGIRTDIYVMESRQAGGVSMYQRIVEILRQEGAVWVSVTRAIDGFGMARSVRKTGWLWKRSEAPLIVTAVGSTECLRTALEEIRHLPGFDGYATTHPVNWYAP